MVRQNPAIRLLARAAKRRLNGEIQKAEEEKAKLAKSELDRVAIRERAKKQLNSDPDDIAPFSKIMNVELFKSLEGQQKQKYFFDLIEIWNEEKTNFERKSV